MTEPNCIWLVIWNDKPAGYPEPFEFFTRKEALKKMQRLAHQACIGEFSVMTKTDWERKQRDSHG